MGVDRTAVLHSAQLFASRGQFDAAISEWRKLSFESPTDGSIFNSIGDLHLKRNSSAEAVAAFLQAAAAFRSEGATLKAIATYKKVLKVDPARYEVYRHLGDLNAERGLLSSAVQDYITLGKHYLKERKTKEALDVYRKIVTQDPSNLDAQQRMAELCLQENLQDEAVNTYLQLGRERSAQQRYDEAKDAYLAVLRIDPNNSEASQYVQNAGKGIPESLKAGRSGGILAPGSSRAAEPLDMLAEVTRRMEEGQYAGAEAILTQILTREPGNPQVCQLLARLHLLRGDLQVALGEYRFLAGAALRAQEYPLAETLISEYLQVEPNCVALLELLGELYEEKGDASTAVVHYGKAIEALVGHPEPGMPDLPIELYEKIKQLDPTGPVARKLAPRFGESAGAPQAGEGGAGAPSKETPALSKENPPVENAAPDDAWRNTSKIDLKQDRHLVHNKADVDRPSPPAGDGASEIGGLRIAGAKPDAPFATRRASASDQSQAFSIENAKPDGHGTAALKRTGNASTDSTHRLWEQAKSSIAKGSRAEAEGVLAQFLQGQPNHVEARHLLGRLYEEKGDGAGAALQYARSLELLLENPSQGATNLPVELYHKIKTLAPASPVVSRLASRFEQPAKQGTPLTGAPSTAPTPDACETRYALGVAFKNMGLFDEAREEFEISIQGTDYFIDSSLMLALCFKEQGRPQLAIGQLERLLADSRCTGQKALTIRYELGILYESAGHLDQALQTYAVIPSFHDVPRRVESIKAKSQIAKIG